MITGLDHIELIVRDLGEYIEFLERLGFEVVACTTHHGESAELRIPGSEFPVFELHQVRGEEVIGVNHLAFRVDDLEATHRELVDTPIRLEGEPAPVASTGRTNLNLRDPDGWRMQLVAPTRSTPDPTEEH